MKPFRAGLDWTGLLASKVQGRGRHLQNVKALGSLEGVPGRPSLNHDLVPGVMDPLFIHFYSLVCASAHALLAEIRDKSSF
jgi:hypothetical protein